MFCKLYIPQKDNIINDQIIQYGFIITTCILRNTGVAINIFLGKLKKKT